MSEQADSLPGMSDGSTWPGAHHSTPASAVTPGMLGGISLTVARGMEPDEFLIALGSDLDELAARIPYRDLAVPTGRPGRPSPRVNPVMYGVCGEWVYVLEDWGMATWATGYRKVESMRPGPGEEIVCVTLNQWSPPSQIIHVPGDERPRRAEFGQNTGEASALDAAGAVFPSMPDASEAEVAAYYEDHGERLPEAVFTAVGAYCGLAIDQTAVKAGDLSAALIPMI